MAALPQPRKHTAEPLIDFRARTILFASVVSLLLMTPFSANNFLEGRLALGAGSLFIVLFFVYTAWTIRRGRHKPMVTVFGLFTPILFFLFTAYEQQGVVGVLWTFPAIISFYFMFPERWAWIANVVFMIVLMPKAWLVLENGLAIRVAATCGLVSALSAISMRLVESQQRQLAELAITDPLTGLHNRSLLKLTLERTAQHILRSGKQSSLVALDVDYFKQINDSLGHDVGDTVLRDLSEILRGRLRSTDPIFRVGGEEFLVVLEDTTLEQARAIAEDLRQEIANSTMLPERAVTASFGIAVLDPGQDWSCWHRRADEQLYNAKMRGRNRVVA